MNMDLPFGFIDIAERDGEIARPKATLRKTFRVTMAL